MTPPSTSITAISSGLSNSTVLIKSCAATPITTAGRNATSTEAMNCRAAGSRGASGKDRDQPRGVNPKDRQNGAQLDDDLEGLSGRMKPQKNAPPAAHARLTTMV